MTNAEWLEKIEKQVRKSPLVSQATMIRLLDIEEFEGAKESRRANKIISKVKVAGQW